VRHKIIKSEIAGWNVIKSGTSHIPQISHLALCPVFLIGGHVCLGSFTLVLDALLWAFNAINRYKTVKHLFLFFFHGFQSCLWYCPGGCVCHSPCRYCHGGADRPATGVFACQMSPFKCTQLCLHWHGLCIAFETTFFFFLNVEVRPGFGAFSFCQQHLLL